MECAKFHVFTGKANLEGHDPVTGQQPLSGFSSRGPGRCLPQAWQQWTSPLLPSVLHDAQWARRKGCRVAGTVIEAKMYNTLSTLPCQYAPLTSSINTVFLEHLPLFVETVILRSPF
jgi:hypothetical protein